MEWGRIKTVLICLFLVINLFLGASLWRLQREKYQIASNLLDDVVEVLETKQIEIDRSLVPQNRIVMRGFLFLPPNEGYDQAAERLLGGCEKTQEEATTVFTSGQNKLEFLGQSDVFFEGLWQQYKYTFDVEGAQKVAQSFLNTLCDNELDFFLVRSTYDPVEKTYHMEYGQELENIDILNARIRIDVNQEGVAKAVGTVVYTACYPYERGRLSDSFDFLLKYPLQEEIRQAGEVEITGIQPVYHIAKRDAVDVLYAGWKITAKDQAPIIFNAMTGERIKS